MCGRSTWNPARSAGRVPRTTWSVRSFQLELDVDEVVRRPRAGILEGEDILVFPADVLHPLVERRFLLAIHEECGVEDHAVADRLVAPAGDGHGLQELVDVRDVPLAGFLE